MSLINSFVRKGVLPFLVLALMLLSAECARVAITEHRLALQSKDENATADLLLHAAGDFAFERGQTEMLLNLAPPASAAAIAAIAAKRDDGEKSLSQALSRLRPDAAQALTGVRHEVDILRRLASRDLVLPRQARQPLLPIEWFAGMTLLIEGSQGLRMHAVYAPKGVEARLAELQTIKHRSWVMSEFAGRERAEMAALIARGDAVPPALLERLGNDRGRVESAWQVIDAYADGPEAPRNVRRAASQVRSMFLDRFERVREVTYAAAAAGGTAYPLDAQAWFSAATQGIDTILALNVALGAAAADLATESARDSLRNIVAGLSLMMLILVLAGLSAREAFGRERDQSALRDGEDLLDRIGQVANVGGWDYDLVTGEVWWSKETYRLHGVDPNYRPTIDKAVDFYASEARPVIRAAVEACLAGGGPWDLELRFIRADGRELWVRATGSLVVTNGKPARLVGAFQDISTRFAERLALQVANERVKLATQTGGIGIWEWDIKSNLLTWDAGMYRLYGMQPRDGFHAYDLWRRHLHPDDLARVEQALRDNIAGSGPLDVEFRVIWSNGSVRHIRGSGQVVCDALGHPARMVGVNWDLTELRQHIAERNLQIERQTEAAERETAMFRNSPDVQYIVSVSQNDGEDIFLHETFSPALLHTTGWRPEDMVGLSPEACLPPPIATAVSANYRRCVAARTTISHVDSYATPVGQREFEGSITPIQHPTSGQIVRLVGLLRDVTERNRTEAALHQSHKMEAIGRLAAGVAHDFNNILQGISGGLELVLDEVVPGSQAHDFIEMGLRSAKRGSDLTHHLLSYARKQILRPELVDLPVLLSDVGKMLSRTLGPHIAIHMPLGQTVSSVRVDSGQLQTALLNLAINASHAMKLTGKLTIDVCGAVSDGQSWVDINVTDNGVGMDEATLSKAVDPFFTTKGQGGTGLGLSMVKGFVEQSGGVLLISSALGFGTTAKLRLPAVTILDVANTSVSPCHQPAATGCVLLVDDDTDVLVTTGTLLERAGFTVIHAQDGTQALRLLTENARIDAVVTDYAMPDMNGSDLISQAWISRPDLPAVIISGFVEIAGSETLSERIVTLHKPFEGQALVQVLRNIIELWPRESARQDWGSAPSPVKGLPLEIVF